MAVLCSQDKDPDEQAVFAQAELKEKLSKMYNVNDVQNVFVFGFRTQVRTCSGCPY